MALTKLSSFGGEAEVQGVLRRVNYDHGILSIEGLNLDDAYAILEALSAKKLVGVRLPVAAPTPDKPGPSAPERSSEDQPVQSHAAPQTLPAPSDQFVPLTPEEKKALDDKAEKLEQKSNVLPMPGVLPDNIAQSKRFIEVLSWVMKSKGLTPKDEARIVEELEAIKDSCPAVRRVRDLKEKVQTNLASFMEAGEAS